MRLFIAIDFNELKESFRELQRKLPQNARLSLTKTFHLTLKFLGEAEPNKVEAITDILKNIKFEPFAVYVDGVGVFPTENYIRVVWAGISPEEKVIALQKNIDEHLKKFFKKEKDFKAHITLARVKHPEDKKSFIEQIKKIKVENKRKEIRDFRLIKSALTAQGPVYEDLMVFESKK